MESCQARIFFICVESGQWASHCDAEETRAYIRREGVPIVLKEDELAAGKGVVVAQTMEEVRHVLEHEGFR